MTVDRERWLAAAREALEVPPTQVEEAHRRWQLRVGGDEDFAPQRLPDLGRRLYTMLRLALLGIAVGGTLVWGIAELRSMLDPVTRARELVEAGELQQAIEVLDAHEPGPRAAGDAHVSLAAEILCRLGRETEARERLRARLELDPDAHLPRPGWVCKPR